MRSAIGIAERIGKKLEIWRIVEFLDTGEAGGGRGRRQGKGGSLLRKQLVHFPCSLRDPWCSFCFGCATLVSLISWYIYSVS